MSNISLRDRDTVTAVESGREFWRGVLLAGEFTVLPRWTLDPVPGVGEHDTRIPDELVAALRRLANELAVPLSTVLLTAHAKVLGALSGEREVSAGYAAMEGRSPLLCRMTTEPHSWRAMLLKTHREESELLSHADFPVEDLRRELGLTKRGTAGPRRASHRRRRVWALPGFSGRGVGKDKKVTNIPVIARGIDPLVSVRGIIHSLDETESLVGVE